MTEEPGSRLTNGLYVALRKQTLAVRLLAEALEHVLETLRGERPRAWAEKTPAGFVEPVDNG